MARLTKSEIEQSLLSGHAVTWQEGTKKPQSLQLVEAKQRRLFKFLLASTNREAIGLSSDFIKGLADAADAVTEDPALAAADSIAVPNPQDIWRINSIETEGFGGLNSWGGDPFRLEVDEQSLLLEGPNGSGKSSLIGAMVWALAGERPRERSDQQDD